MKEEKNYEKKEIPISEEDLKAIIKQKFEFELQRDNIALGVDSLKKQVELNLPLRNMKEQLEQGETQLERINKNISVLQRQIRTKKRIEYIPKEPKKEATKETEKGGK